MLGKEIHGLCHLFEVKGFRPTLITFALALGQLLLNIHKPLRAVRIGGDLGGFFLPYAPGNLRVIFCSLNGSDGVLLENGKDSGFVKVRPQLPGGDGLRPVRREVTEPPPALLNGHARPQHESRKLVKAGGGGKGLAYGLPQTVFVGFKLGLPGCDTLGKQGGVFLVQLGLPLALRPVFTLGHFVSATVQEVDLVKPLPMAHLHDFAAEIPHGGCGAAVFVPGSGVACPIHVGLALHLGDPQTVDDNMHMDISAVVVPVRVGADKGLVSGKMLFAVGQPQRLRPVNGQAIVGCVPWVKADDIVVALDVLPFAVLAIPQIFPDAGQGKILVPAVQRVQPVVLPGNEPPGFIKGGLHGKLVMLKGEIGFGGSVVGIFRADMFDRCHRLHLSLSAPRI